MKPRRREWTALEVDQLRVLYPDPEKSIEDVMIALPDRTAQAIRVKAGRLGVGKLQPRLDIFLKIDREPNLNLYDERGRKVTITPGDVEKWSDPCV